jgi:hypothetical protein
MRVRGTDKWALGVAAAAALGSFVWFGLRRPAPAAVFPMPVDAGENFEATLPEPLTATERAWPAPSAQRRGAGWVYDLFTPPDLVYDASTRQLIASAVNPDANAAAADPPARISIASKALGLKLRRVQRALFRLQLVGYVGERERELGVFENTATGETFLAGEPRRVPELGLVIEAFSVRREPLPGVQGTQATWRTANARVRDERTGEQVCLTDRHPVSCGPLIATLAQAERDKTLRDVKTGDEITLVDTTYRVTAVRSSPPSVDLMPMKDGANPGARFTLTADAPDAPAPGELPSI